MSSFSVLVVNWNGREDLRACLRSLGGQSDRDFEIVVVDNGSSDGSLEMVRDGFPEVVLIDAGENLGFAEGNNRGIPRCRGEWVICLNCDAEAEPGFVEALRAAASESAADVGMLQARMVFKQRPHIINSAGVLLRSGGRFVDRGFDEPVERYRERVEIFCPSAGAAAYRRTMLEAIRLDTGYFDRTFFMYFEDVDLGWRARLAGWSALYVPTATVKHAFHGSASRKGQHFVALHCKKNRIRTLLKNASWPLVGRGVPLTTFDTAWSLLRGGPASLGAIGQAVRDGLAQRGEVERVRRVSRQDIERRFVLPLRHA